MTTTYDIKYHTQNAYEASVTEALYELLVAPCQNDTQVVRDLVYRNSLGEDIYQHRNPFGFQLACLRANRTFTNFEFYMTASVEKRSLLDFALVNLSVQEEQAILNSLDFQIENFLYLEQGPFTSIGETYQHKVLHRQEGQSVYDFLLQLNQFIYSTLEFDAESTHVHTTANDVMALGRGVCQDYTHLFLGMARANRIPCRYVSGYLNQGGELVGSAVMHAWVEAYVPGNGWRGFDPTNNLLADIDHIKAAHGSDYSDCSPIKGVLKSTGLHQTSYGVKVIPKAVEEEEAQQVQQ